MNFFGMGATEILLVLVVALILLGPGKMIETARTLGKYARELQRATSELPRLLSMEEDDERQRRPARTQLPETPPLQGQQAKEEEDDKPVPRA